MNARDWNDYLFAPTVVIGDPAVQDDTRIVSEGERRDERRSAPPPQPLPQLALQTHPTTAIPDRAAAARRAWLLSGLLRDDDDEAPALH